MSVVHKILIVEDDPMWQAAFQQLLSTLPNTTVCDVVDHYDAALASYKHHQPDFVVLDFELNNPSHSPVKTGLDVASAFIEQGLPTTQMVLVSASEPSTIGEHPLHAIPKSMAGSHLAPWIQTQLATMGALK